MIEEAWIGLFLKNYARANLIKMPEQGKYAFMSVKRYKRSIKFQITLNK